MAHTKGWKVCVCARAGWGTENWQKEKTKRQRRWRARNDGKARAHVRNNKNTRRFRSLPLSPCVCVCVWLNANTLKSGALRHLDSALFPLRTLHSHADCVLIDSIFVKRKKRKCCNASRYKNRHKYLLRVCSFFCVFVCLFVVLKKKIHGDLPPAKIR